MSSNDSDRKPDELQLHDDKVAPVNRKRLRNHDTATKIEAVNKKPITSRRRNLVSPEVASRTGRRKSRSDALEFNSVLLMKYSRDTEAGGRRRRGSARKRQ
uniref:Uncharacterized protein n=1 Tax=Ditylenchus dipsaci TaxID=166011 RepID=A0A915DUX2_9BILA